MEMAADQSRYDLYRVYEMSEAGAQLRIAEDMSDFAAKVLASFRELPDGVTADSVSVSPSRLGFGQPFELTAPTDELAENE